MKGCEVNPSSEELWLEAARLQPPDTARAVIAHAARNLPHSVRVWVKAADLEQETKVRSILVYHGVLPLIKVGTKLWLYISK